MKSNRLAICPFMFRFGSNLGILFGTNGSGILLQDCLDRFAYGSIYLMPLRVRRMNLWYGCGVLTIGLRGWDVEFKGGANGVC